MYGVYDEEKKAYIAFFADGMVCDNYIDKNYDTIGKGYHVDYIDEVYVTEQGVVVIESE